MPPTLPAPLCRLSELDFPDLVCLPLPEMPELLTSPFFSYSPLLFLWLMLWKPSWTNWFTSIKFGSFLLFAFTRIWLSPFYICTYWLIFLAVLNWSPWACKARFSLRDSLLLELLNFWWAELVYFTISRVAAFKSLFPLMPETPDWPDCPEMPHSPMTRSTSCLSSTEDSYGPRNCYVVFTPCLELTNLWRLSLSLWFWLFETLRSFAKFWLSPSSFVMASLSSWTSSYSFLLFFYSSSISFFYFSSSIYFTSRTSSLDFKSFIKPNTSCL